MSYRSLLSIIGLLSLPDDDADLLHIRDGHLVRFRAFPCDGLHRFEGLVVLDDLELQLIAQLLAFFKEQTPDAILHDEVIDDVSCLVFL